MELAMITKIGWIRLLFRDSMIHVNIARDTQNHIVASL